MKSVLMGDTMTNKSQKLATIIQHYSNSGLGWEPMPEHLGGTDKYDLTRVQANALASTRSSPKTSSVIVYDEYGETLAVCERDKTALVWIF